MDTPRSPTSCAITAREHSSRSVPRAVFAKRAQPLVARAEQVEKRENENGAMMTTQTIFLPIEAGDLEATQALLDADPMLAHARHADPGQYHWTALQFAA